MTEQEIYFQYYSVIRQAEVLDEIAQKMEKLSSYKMNSTLRTLKIAWQSDNSAQYYQKAEKVQEEVQKTAFQIRKIADGIRTTAEAVKNSELRALEIAQESSCCLAPM